MLPEFSHKKGISHLIYPITIGLFYANEYVN